MKIEVKMQIDKIQRERKNFLSKKRKDLEAAREGVRRAESSNPPQHTDVELAKLREGVESLQKELEALEESERAIRKGISDMQTELTPKAR